MSQLLIPIAKLDELIASGWGHVPRFLIERVESMNGGILPAYSWAYVRRARQAIAMEIRKEKRNRRAVYPHPRTGRKASAR